MNQVYNNYTPLDTSYSKGWYKPRYPMPAIIYEVVHDDSNGMPMIFEVTDIHGKVRSGYVVAAWGLGE